MLSLGFFWFFPLFMKKVNQKRYDFWDQALSSPASQLMKNEIFLNFISWLKRIVLKWFHSDTNILNVKKLEHFETFRPQEHRIFFASLCQKNEPRCADLALGGELRIFVSFSSVCERIYFYKIHSEQRTQFCSRLVK